MTINKKVTLLAALICLITAGCSGKTQTQETLSESEAQARAESLVEDANQQVSAAESMAEALMESAGIDADMTAPAAGEDDTAPAAADDTAETAADASAETAANDADAMVSDPAAALAVPVPLMYTGEDPYMPAVLRWMEENPATYYDTGDYYIPAPVVFYTDDTDPADIRIWGNFWVFRYDLEDGNLLMQSGGEHPGLLHLKKSEDDVLGYEATDFEAVQDGSDYDSSLKEICGKAPAEAGDLYAQYSSAADDGTNDAVREEYLRMYADQVPFPIVSYQDPGWDPVLLEK